MNRKLTAALIVAMLIGCGTDESHDSTPQSTPTDECQADAQSANEMMTLFNPGDRIADAVKQHPELKGLLSCGWHSKYTDDEGREVRAWHFIWAPETNSLVVIDGVVVEAE